MIAGKFIPRKIDTPSWARDATEEVEGLSQDEYDTLQSKMDVLLKIVNDEVTEYLNDPDLVCYDDDGFPNISRMTGEYYIEDKLYYKYPEDSVVQISIMTHFLEEQWHENQNDFDYLGLEVHVRFSADWTITSVDVDSSSI